MSVKIEEEKQMLREHYRDVRKKLSSEYKTNLDFELASRFLTSDEYVFSKTLLMFCATNYEVETREIINAALASGKKVALPVCSEEGKMDFYFINSLSELSLGKFRIYEPSAIEENRVSDFKNALCAVPGFTFDPKGNRLGYGGGYYDRFLKEFDGISVGLCYSSFVRWDVPCEEADVPVDVLVTDAYVRKTKV